MTILSCQIVDDAIHVGRNLASGNLQAKHELERLLVRLLIVALQIAILLLVASVRLEENDCLFGDRDYLQILHLLRAIISFLM